MGRFLGAVVLCGALGCLQPVPEVDAGEVLFTVYPDWNDLDGLALLYWGPQRGQRLFLPAPAEMDPLDDVQSVHESASVAPLGPLAVQDETAPRSFPNSSSQGSHITRPAKRSAWLLNTGCPSGRIHPDAVPSRLLALTTLSDSQAR